MKPILFGSALTLAAGLAGSPMAQTVYPPLTGLPGGDGRVAAVCTEIDLLQARDLIDQVAPALRTSAQIIFQIAEEYQDDGNDHLCAQKIQELRALAQSGLEGPAFIAGREVDLRIPGASPVAISPGAVASSCTEIELARVSDLINQAPASMEGVLRRKLQIADQNQDEGNLQRCANTLAEIRIALEGPSERIGMGTDATPGVIPSPYGIPLVASECTETDLARVSDLIGQAPESLQGQLRRQLQEADQNQDEGNLQRCAQDLAEIRNILETTGMETVGAAE